MLEGMFYKMCPKDAAKFTLFFDLKVSKTFPLSRPFFFSNSKENLFYKPLKFWIRNGISRKEQRTLPILRKQGEKGNKKKLSQTFRNLTLKGFCFLFMHRCLGCLFIRKNKKTLRQVGKKEEQLSFPSAFAFFFFFCVSKERFD